MRSAVIIGAGPAGLTAAAELQARTGVVPVILEAGTHLGGIARTESYAGNRIDIGGHRFFSKSARVMDWWLDVLPLQALDAGPGGALALTYQRQQRILKARTGPAPEVTDRVMLVRERQSRIYHRGQFFDYPLSLSPQTLSRLGLRRSARIGASYLRASCLPRAEESLEDFFINRFGRELYLTFFKDYTEKVWGVPCQEISAEWGAQRIKGLSLRGALRHFFERLLPASPGSAGPIETSLIEQFLYPKLGPGQLWEEVGRRIEARGGTIHLRHRVTAVHLDAAGRVCAVEADTPDGPRRFSGDLFFSTMPVQDLIRAVQPAAQVPAAVRTVSEGLLYRDFITVGLLTDAPPRDGQGAVLRDNWLYIQEPGVQVGRIQLFHNWSPWLVATPGTGWLGLEYFCSTRDPLWRQPDADLLALARAECAQIGLLRGVTVQGGVVLRASHTYPAYFGTYSDFDRIRQFTDQIDNLYLIGRNGMHRYNNQDHSMLTAMVAVDGILAGRQDRDAIWSVNAEADYHEEAST